MGAGVPCPFARKSQKHQTNTAIPVTHSGVAENAMKPVSIFGPVRNRTKGINPATMQGAKMKNRMDLIPVVMYTGYSDEPGVERM